MPPNLKICDLSNNHQAPADKEGPRAPTQNQISYLALRALLSIAACVSRPVFRSLPGVTLAPAVPGGSAAQACLRALLRGDAAAAHPLHHALAAQLAADAVSNHAELLDALLFPSELEEEQRQQRGSGGGAPPLALPAPEGATAAAPAAAAGGAAGAVAVRKGPRARQALDGLYATLQQAARLKKEHPRVLASSLWVLAAMWRQPAAAQRTVSVLRAAKGLWGSLEACLEPVSSVAGAAAAGSGAGSPQTAAAQQQLAVEVRSCRALCEAFALQILTGEAFACARFLAAAAAATADGSEAHALLDKLVRGGTLLRLVRSEPGVLQAADAAAAATGGSLALEARAVGTLQAAAAAPYLEMGFGVVSELWGPPGEPDGVSVAAAVRQELSGVKSLMNQGVAILADIQAAHDDLLAGALQQTHGSPGAQSMDDYSMLQLPPTHQLAQLLQRQCLGAELVRRCHVATTDLSQLPGGPAPPLLGHDHVLSRARLLAVLGPAAESLSSVDMLTAALLDVNATSSLGEALLLQLQAACSLTAVLAQDGRLLTASTAGANAAAAAALLLDPPSAAGEPATPAGAAAGPSTSTAPAAGGGGLLTSVQAACWAAVSGLLAWSSSPDSRAALQPDWGLRRLHAQHVAAALTTSRLLLSVLQSARQALSVPSAAAAAAAAGAAGAGVTPARTPGLSSVFGTSITVTPVATARKQGAGGAAVGPLGGGVAGDPGYLPFVVSLARQLAAWNRAVVAAGLPQCPPAVAAQITDGLAGALLLALQPLQPEGALPEEQQQLQAGDRQALAASLQSSIPQLCDLASSGSISISLAAQLLLESTRHLAAHDWLPLLLNHLDLGEHILLAASRAAGLAAGGGGGGGASNGALRSADAAAAAGDLGMLALALVVAQVPDGARALYDRGVVDQLVAAGRHLLSGAGGRLAAFSVIAVTGTGPYRPGVDGTYASTATRRGGNGAAGPPPDTCGAYIAAPAAAAAAGLGDTQTAADAAGEGEVWSPVHRQWCTLLQFSAALLKTLGQHMSMEREALDLLLALEPRLMLAVLPPGGDVLQPLTLANLVELEAALFLLGELTAYLGGWHMVLPASLLNFRTAVSTLLTWLAQPTLAKAFAVDCRPRTAREAAMAATTAIGIPSSDGWFRACTIGAATAAAGSGAGGQAATLAAAAAAAGGGGMGSPITGAIPSISSLSRGLSEAIPSTPLAGGAAGGSTTPAGAAGLLTPVAGVTPGRAATGLAGLGTSGGAAGATPGAAGAAAAGTGSGFCSEYSAQMAEKLYTCAQHALLFLVASSPQLSQGEAASLGPAWPRPRDLSALLEQCMCSAESLTRCTEAPAAQPRRSRVVRLLGRVGQLCDNFLSVLGASAAAGAAGGVGGAFTHGAGGGGGGGAGGAAAREHHAREWLASLELGAGAVGRLSGFALGGGLGPQTVSVS